MALQEDGWPLGLQPLNARVGLVIRNHGRSGSISFSTLLPGSPTSSTDSSSDLDTQSTGSFFRQKSITLGSLMGVSSFLELSRRSIRARQIITSREKKNTYRSKPWLFSLCSEKKNTYRSKPWLFSLCSKLCTDTVSTSHAPSLGHLLQVERRATCICRRNPSSPANGPYNFSQVLPAPEPNSLFDGGRIDPARWSSSRLDLDSNSNGKRRSNGDLFESGSGDGTPLA